MIKLTNFQMLDLRGARAEFAKIQVALAQIESLARNTPAEEEATVNYVIERLQVIDTSAQATIIFLVGDQDTPGAGLSVLKAGENYDTLMQLADNLIKEASNADMTRVNISGEQSLTAAKALLEAFNISQSLLPDPRIATKQAELKAIIAAATCMLKEPGNPITNTAELNQYVSDESKRISDLTNPSERLTLYQRLKTNMMERTQALDEKPAWHACIPNKLYRFFIDEADNQTQKDTYLTLRKTVVDAIKAETDSVIADFDALTATFRQKIANLKARNYDSVVETANALLDTLETEKSDFKNTSDLPAFKQNMNQLLNTFEGHSAFEANRESEYWLPIRVFIDILRWLIGPYTTDTSQKFDDYTKGLKSLGEEEQETPSPGA
jgi:hypothetical protein